MEKICPQCGLKTLHHIQNWIEDILDHLLFSRFFLPKKFEKFLEDLIERFFIFSRLISPKKDFSPSDLQLRTAVFIEKAKKEGIEFEVLKSPFGYTNHFRMEIKGRLFSFEGLPRAEFLSSHKSQIIDDKYLVKKYLKKGNFPVLDGKAFWWFQKKKALKLVNQLDFPLVVKPRSGSLSRHLTTDIQDLKSLEEAIDRVISYSPTFIIEKFLPESYTYRATVVDFNNIFCVQQIPANLIGDGIHSIKELIEIKNADPQRGDSRQKNTILCKIVVDETTEKLLKSKGYNFSTILSKGEIIYLQKDSFLKLGGDLIEVTPLVHPDNLQLFSNVAKYFDVRLVGIDFLAQNISLSWKTQKSAILELNSLPSIEMHYFPSFGKPQNVAKTLTKMVLNYYL